MMVETRNGEATGYDPVAKALHWLIFALLIAQFAAAWTMPHIGRNTKPETLINLHFSFGVTIIFVVVLRLLWRLSRRVPPPVGVPEWQRAAAHLFHGLLYLMLIVLPIMGWVSASMRGWPVDFYGVITIPQIVATNPAMAGRLGDVHAQAGTILLILVGLHVAAVLYHVVIRRDRVLQRMLPAAR
jgi:cytochrome b561